MVVISLGGSIVAGGEMNRDYLLKFREFMDETDKRIFVVVGGGATARKYIEIARELEMDEYSLDKIGIEATRLNARLLLTPKSYPHVPESIDEAIIASKSYKNVVMGGTEPGHTTDGVALLLAEKLGEKRVINMTSVGGIYDRDPRKYEDAKLIPKMSYEDAKRFFISANMDAGLSIPFDLLALKIAERSRIKIYVVGNDIENLRKVITNGDYKGTVIE